MAKNITLLGASYTGVPGVLLPQTGGGTALFTDVGDTTAVAADVAEGKIFFATDGSKQVGTSTGGGGGNDFIIALTYDRDGIIPDCTYAEAVAAYTGGKNVAYTSADGSAYGVYTPEEECIYLILTMQYASGNWSALGQCVSMWTSAGVEVIQDPEQQSPPNYAYFTSNATAVPADVASGKKFFNADGYQVGTASGGGGLDASYKAVIRRDNAEVTLPDDLTKVGNYAFYDGRNLRLSSLPSGITSIGQYAFGFTAINVTSLPNGVTSIGRNAFYGCPNLALTSLPSGITTISQYCFYGCTRLALTSLPSGVTSIEQYAFYECSGLALASLPSGITSISAYAFYNCYAVTISSLPDAVTYIGVYAFRGCESMTGISCNGAITTLGSNAFYGLAGHLSQLKYARFPNMAVSSLGTVFGSSTEANACQQLELADIGSTAAITANAFRQCYKLQTLILRKSGAVCTLANTSAFTNTPMRGYNSLSGTIYVPSALISTYQTATNWSTIYGEGHVTFAAIEGSEYEL